MEPSYLLGRGDAASDDDARWTVCYCVFCFLCGHLAEQGPDATFLSHSRADRPGAAEERDACPGAGFSREMTRLVAASTALRGAGWSARGAGRPVPGAPRLAAVGGPG